MTKREQASSWLQELSQAGKTLTEIGRETKIQETTLASIRDVPDGRIWEDKYNSIKAYYERCISDSALQLVHISEGAEDRTQASKDRLQIPRSARDAYEQLQNYGGQPEWIDLPDEERSGYEGDYKLLELEIDQINQETERETAKLQAQIDELNKKKSELARELPFRITDAVRKFEKRITERRLGYPPGSGKTPF